MDTTAGKPRRIATAAGVGAGLALVAAVVAFVRPLSTEVERIAGVTLPCGSLLDPIPVGSPYYCDNAQNGRASVVIGLVALALVLAIAAVALRAQTRADTWRVVRWSAWPVVYGFVVVSAWVVTYPYVQTRDDISGLEYLYQLTVSAPLGWIVPAIGDPAATTLANELLVAGLVQVGLVAWFCRWGFVRSRKRAEDVRDEPRAHAPVT